MGHERIFYLFILLCLIPFNFTCCMSMNHRNREWSPAVSAPEKYPSKLIWGTFILPDGTRCSLRGSDCSNPGWGESDGGTSASATKAPIKLDITWWSLTENQYYAGVFDLPQEKIDSLLSQGVIDNYTKRHMKYDDIMVGMAPGGVCVVWLRRGYSEAVEIGRYQAEKIEMIPMSRYDDSTSWYARQPDQEKAQADFAKMVIESEGLTQYLEDHGIPFGLWDTYREKFCWRPRMVYEDPNCIADEITISYYNGERQGLVLDRLRENPFDLRPRVKSIMCCWSSGDVYKDISIQFDEEEVFELFGAFWGEDPSIQAELQLLINDTNDQCRVLLVSCDERVHKRLEFKRIQVRISTLEERLTRFFEVNLDKNR